MDTITHPCKHTHSLDESLAGATSRHGFLCPTCGCRWVVEVQPARRLESGFIMPGDRRVVVLWPGSKRAVYANPIMR